VVEYYYGLNANGDRRVKSTKHQALLSCDKQARVIL